MAVCACDTCPCAEPLPAGEIGWCRWCVQDQHNPIRTESGAMLRVTTTKEGIVLQTWRGSLLRRHIVLDADAARQLADQLDLAIIGGSK